MKCEDVSSFFTRLPGVESSPNIGIGQRLKGLMEKLREAIATWVVHSSDPTIHERHDRKGNVYYQVYDPRTQKSAVFGSELEIRYWLEQRYAR
jgi:hypothetical protein